MIRRGPAVHRPAGPGSEIVAALLTHLRAVGFDAAPRHLGLDEMGRHRVEFVEGDTFMNPPWQSDDEANATMLGRIATMVRGLHEASRGFAAPAGAMPARRLPIPGATWTHGDVGYANVVFRSGRPVALIDWEFAAPADPVCDPAGLLALGVRGPKPGVDDNDRRAEATRLAADAIAAGYGGNRPGSAGPGPFHRDGLWAAAAAVLDDAADHWTDQGSAASSIAALRWRADWFRSTDPTG